MRWILSVIFVVGFCSNVFSAATFSKVKTVVAGETITASDRNAEFDNILNNFNPAGMDDYSTDATEMRTTADPYSGGAESLATSLQGELERLRYILNQIIGETYWYQDPNIDLATSSTTFSSVATSTAALANTFKDGWVSWSGTWTYISSCTFSVSGDQTAYFDLGAKVKLTQTTAKYFYITTAAYTTSVTTVSVYAGSSYTLANAAITSPKISRSEHPQGFPHYFAYSPTLSAGWGVTSGEAFKFRLVGPTMFIRGVFTAGNGAASVGTFSIPDGFAFDTTKMSASNSSEFLGPVFQLSNAGNTLYSTANSVLAAYYSNPDLLNTYITNRGQGKIFDLQNVTDFLTNGDTISIDVELPVKSR